MATKKKATTYTVRKGIRYPKVKAERDRIRAGEATSADVTEWVREKPGSGVVIPADLVEDFESRNAIEKED